MNEEWKPIKDYENKYECSNLGRIRSLCDCRGNILNEPKILKQAKNNRDYCFIVLCKDGIKKQFLIHRIVALTFLENQEQKRTVDHIDKDKSNNKLTNLRWATDLEQLENKTYPETINGRLGVSGEKYIHKTKSGYRVYNKRNNPILGYFNSLEEAISFRNDYLKTL